MNPNNVANLRRLFFRAFIVFCIFILFRDNLNAQSQWSDSPMVNNPIVTLPGSDQVSPVIARDGFGGAIIAWVDNRNGNFDIYFQRVEPSGQLTWFGEGMPVDSDPDMASQESPAIVDGSQGDFFIAWLDNRNESSEREIFAQKYNIAGQPVWDTATRAHRRNNSAPLLFRNSSFGVITVSYISGLFDDLISFQIINHDGFPQLLPQQGILSNNAKGTQPNKPPSVISGLDGGLIAVWVDTRNDSAEIYAKGIQKDGATPWKADEVLVSTTVTEQSIPVAIHDNQGGVIIAWINPINGSQDDIKVQRLDLDGERQWETAGTWISSTQGKKRNIAITSDSKNGAYIIWENLIGSNWKLITQRVTRNGVFWTNDLRLSHAGGDQTTASLAIDGRGQAIAAWEDNRNGNLDIYAQKLDSTGLVRSWGGAGDGIAISRATNAQRKPVLVHDEFGGAIIAWEDIRNINTKGKDVYAQKVSASGILGEIRNITILSPQKVDNWEFGSDQIIRWQWVGEIDKVVIELWNVNEKRWQAIDNGTKENTGITSWNVNRGSSRYLLRISDLNSPFVNAVSDTFTISAQSAPAIQHIKVTRATYGDSLLISAVVTDISGIENVILSYNKGGARNQQFYTESMVSVSGNTFSQRIPTEFVTEWGVDYFISSMDSLANNIATDTFFVSVDFESGIQTKPITRGSSQNAYRMISTPNLLNQSISDSVFSVSGFGVYDTTAWRLFHYRNDAYVERDSINASTFIFEPGEAYWLISSRDRTVNFGSGVSLRADTSFTLKIDSGWNQIGLPFAFPVSWNAIFTASGEPDGLSKPSLYNGNYFPADTLEPYKGYFIFNPDTSSSIDLRIPPVTSSDANPSLASVNSSNSDWAVQIKASCQEARDNYNFIGIKELASKNWDKFDYPEPPPIGEYVSVYFPRTDWEVYPNNYTTDFTNELGQGKTWILTVETNISNSEAKIEFSGLETIPQNLEIWLVDEHINITKNLAQENVYSFPTGNSGATKILKLLVGKREYLSSEIPEDAFIPKDFELSQNFPNPFNPTTAIRYGLPKAAKVRLQIFDLLGRLVATLIDDEQKAKGFHVINWDSKDMDGQTVASGLYIYRLIAGEYKQTRKMLLVK